EVDVHEALVVVPRHGEQQVQLHIAVDGGVVDQVVDATEFGDGEIGQRRGGFGIGDVDLGEDGGAAVGDDLLRHGGAEFGIAVGDHDFRALGGQRLGVGGADAARGSGDNGRLSGETDHDGCS